MEKHGDHVELTDDEASAGVTGHGARYVLGISLGLAIIILSFMWMTGAILN